MTADLKRMLEEAHDAVKAFQDIQAQATRRLNANAKADLAVLKSNEFARLKTRLPQVGARLASVTTGQRARTATTKAADKSLEAAISAFAKRIKEGPP